MDSAIKNNELMLYSNKRKHGSQLTTEEVDRIFNSLRSVHKYHITHHAVSQIQNKIKAKRIRAKYNDIKRMPYDSTIVEYRIVHHKKNDYYDERVLLRSNKTYSGYNLCAVFSITTKKIVTVWVNRHDDNHKTLRYDELYDDDMKVFGDAV